MIFRPSGLYLLLPIATRGDALRFASRLPLAFISRTFGAQMNTHAQGGVGHSESWRAGALVGVRSRPKVVIRITEPTITAAATSI